jgi:hypothetical protein
MYRMSIKYIRLFKFLKRFQNHRHIDYVLQKLSLALKSFYLSIFIYCPDQSKNPFI